MLTEEKILLEMTTAAQILTKKDEKKMILSFTYYTFAIR
jgi:hypothetical protein